MKKFKLIIVFAALTMVSNVYAFECPKHFKAAQDKIDKVVADMKGMKGKMDKQEHALVHALLDDAKMRLVSARHNHEKPQGLFDHARAMAKADGALGYANAADHLHFKYMKN